MTDNVQFFSLQSLGEKMFFPVMLFIAALLYIWILKPKKLCWLRVLCGFVVIALFIFFASWLRDKYFEWYPMADEYRFVDWLKYYIATAIENICIVALVTLILRFAFSGKTSRVFFVMTAAYATNCICSCVINIVTVSAGQISFFQAIGSNPYFAFLFLVYAGIYAAAYFLLSRRYKDMEDLYINGKSILLYAAVAVVAIVLGSVSASPDDSIVNIYVLLFVSIAVCCLFILVMQFMVLRWYSLKISSFYQQEFIERQKERYEEMRDNMDAVGIKVHDLKHIIRVLRDGNGNQEALDEFEHTVDASSIFFDTGSEALDVILTEKGKQCIKEDIEFSVIANGSVLNGMAEMDIYSLFCNALDNAIEANRKAEAPRFVSVRVTEDNMTGNSTNKCSGGGNSYRKRNRPRKILRTGTSCHHKVRQVHPRLRQQVHSQCRREIRRLSGDICGE